MASLLRHFQRLSFPGAVRLTAFRLCQRFLAPHSLVSYSQHAEDLLILHLLHWPREGYYVDIGCNHPERFSNTFLPYLLGWQGLTVDANRRCVEQHRRLRRHDQAVCAGVSDVEESLTFSVFEDSAVSSFDRDHVSAWSRLARVIDTSTVQTTTLTTLFKTQKVPSRFELLSLDVEGFDLKALQGLDFNLFRPALAVVEAPDLKLDAPTSSEIYRLMTDAGYHLAAFAAPSAFFRETRTGAAP